jgi:choice-of-anchor C domain-containing protein
VPKEVAERRLLTNILPPPIFLEKAKHWSYSGLPRKFTQSNITPPPAAKPGGSHKSFCKLEEKKMKLKMILGLVFTLTMSIGAFGQAFTNGGFEDFTCPGGQFYSQSAGSTVLSPWSIGGAGVDVICTYWQNAEGNVSVDLSNLAGGSLSQTFTTVAGINYAVTFNMSGNPAGAGFPANHPYYSPSAKTLTVNATGGTTSNYSYDTATAANTLTDMKWVSDLYNFAATGTSTTLTFLSTTPGAFGPALDNVQITAVSGTVCHRNMSKDGKNSPKTMTFTDLAAFAAHMGHGDTAGPCTTN